MTNASDLKTDPNRGVVYRIRLKGHLEREWIDWLEGLTITLEENGNTLLTSKPMDQSALHGLFKKLRDLGIPLLSVNRLESGPVEAYENNEAHARLSKKGQQMNSVNKTSRILGVAFLFQFITSFTSGLFLRPLWFVDGDMARSLLNIAKNPWLLRVCILLDMLTALGVIFLGAILFVTLRKQNEKLALAALGFYILEGALLGASRVAAFPLLGLSQEFVNAGQPADLLLLAKLAFDSMDFVGVTLHMIAFCAGGILFYYLLDKSRLVPRPLSLWGLLTALPFVLGMPLAILGYEFPFILYVPYVPFEFVIGVWILVKGIKDGPENQAVIGQAYLPGQI